MGIEEHQALEAPSPKPPSFAEVRFAFSRRRCEGFSVEVAAYRMA